MVEVKNVTQMIGEAQLRWCGLALRMKDEEGIRKILKEPVRGRGPRKGDRTRTVR